MINVADPPLEDETERFLRKTYFSIRTLAVISVIAFLLWGMAHAELYCPFYPSIDTVYAPSYTEEGFNRITAGMTEREVVAILGEPLENQKENSETLRSFYTLDGKCWWGDFAWLGQAVFFSNGKVIRTEKIIYYD